MRTGRRSGEKGSRFELAGSRRPHGPSPTGLSWNYRGPPNPWHHKRTGPAGDRDSLQADKGLVLCPLAVLWGVYRSQSNNTHGACRLWSTGILVHNLSQKFPKNPAHIRLGFCPRVPLRLCMRWRCRRRMDTFPSRRASSSIWPPSGRSQWLSLR